jgi:hypothetical protein
MGRWSDELFAYSIRYARLRPRPKAGEKLEATAKRHARGQAYNAAVSQAKKDDKEEEGRDKSSGSQSWGQQGWDSKSWGKPKWQDR